METEESSSVPVGSAAAALTPPPRPPSRTKWTRRVPPPVLIGHAAPNRIGDARGRARPGLPRGAVRKRGAYKKGAVGGSTPAARSARSAAATPPKVWPHASQRQRSARTRASEYSAELELGAVASACRLRGAEGSARQALCARVRAQVVGGEGGPFRTRSAPAACSPGRPAAPLAGHSSVPPRRAHPASTAVVSRPLLARSFRSAICDSLSLNGFFSFRVVGEGGGADAEGVVERLPEVDPRLRERGRERERAPQRLHPRGRHRALVARRHVHPPAGPAPNKPPPGVFYFRHRRADFGAVVNECIPSLPDLSRSFASRGR